MLCERLASLTSILISGGGGDHVCAASTTKKSVESVTFAVPYAYL